MSSAPAAAAAAADASERKGQQRPEGDKEIQLYSLATPNGQKIAIFLEEAEIPYDAHKISIKDNVQFEEWFKGINPNSKIPVIVDRRGPDNSGQPFAVFESAAILNYLAKKYGKFLPSDPRKESLVQQWLAWQISGLGPMLGQLGHFTRFAPVDVPYAKERYLNESRRLLHVLEKALEGKPYIIGDEYTIADMAIFPWLNTLAVQGRLDEVFGGAPVNIKRYIETLSSRPALQRGLKVTPF